MGSRQRRSWIALGCIALLLIGGNVLAARYLTGDIDLTADRLYTLSRGTRGTLTKIDEPITLRFYYSARLGDTVPSYGVYAGRVRQMLDRYAAAAPGKLRLEVYDPQPFSAAEDQAVAFGLQGVPVNEQGETVYFGLAGTNSSDDRQIIPFFAAEREPFLEYDLTRLVHTLAFPKRTVVGLVSSLPLEGDMMAAMQGRPSEPMALLDQLRQTDRIEDLPLDFSAVPAEIDVLMVVHPRQLTPRTLFAIDQFVLKGGKALVFVDPYSELQAATPSPGAPPGGGAASDLEPLFKSWGIRLVPDAVVGDRDNARRVAVSSPERGPQAVDYVAWLSLKGDSLNRDDVITATLDRVNVATAGIIQPLAGATTKLVPLLTSSANASRIPVDKVKGLPDVAGLLVHFKPDGRRYVIAARITGDVETAFPGGPPPAGPAEKSPHAPPEPPAPGDFVKKSAAPINVVVVADSDMLDDRFWAQTRDFFGHPVTVPTAGNADFVANAIDTLAGGADLVDLRSRGSSARPFVVVERIQRAADDQYAARQRALEDKLKQTEAKLRSLTSGDAGSAPAQLSPEQAKTIEQFRADMLATRQQLRAVQADLRRDIGRLKTVLEFCDIALVPILVAAAAIVLGALRLKRRRRRPATG